MCDVVTVTVVIFSNNALAAVLGTIDSHLAISKATLGQQRRRMDIMGSAAGAVYWVRIIVIILAALQCFFRINRQELSWLPTNQKLERQQIQPNDFFPQAKLNRVDNHRTDMLMAIVWSIIKLSRQCFVWSFI